VNGYSKQHIIFYDKQTCENFDNNGTCVTNCPPREVYNPETESFQNNDNFRFHYGALCVESCPGKCSILLISNNTDSPPQVLALNKEHSV